MGACSYLLSLPSHGDFFAEALCAPAVVDLHAERFCFGGEGIEPASIIKSIDSDLVKMANLDYLDVPLPGQRANLNIGEGEDIDKAISRLTKEMKEAAKNLDFEKAAEIRDKVRELKEARIFV